VPPIFLTSAEKKMGHEPILEAIDEVNGRFVRPELDGNEQF
jgi:GTP-binding protein